MHSLLEKKIDNGVLYLTLNNPQNRNALSGKMIAALRKALDDAQSDNETRVIILGARGHVFCAGHDLKELTAARENADAGTNFYQTVMHDCSALMLSIVNHPCPVIADVRGIATAAGCQLVASCDLALASTSARFATPGVNIGLFCSTPMVALSRNIAPKHAMEMLLTGDMINAARAAEIGLVNKAVAEAKMDGQIAQLARKLASKSTMTLSTGKRAFYQQTQMDIADAYHYASQIMVENMLKHDAKEGIRAFIEKRPPKWNDN